MTNQQPTYGKFDEIGTVGIDTFSGYISQAYTSELYWPACIPIYDKIYRADPEVTITRFLFSTWGGKLGLTCELPETVGNRELGRATDDDKRALDFSFSVMQDIEGDGLKRTLSDALTRVPFYGWGWWETPLGVRNEKWKPPNDDPWRSQANDGLLGYRRLSFRRYSTWDSWGLDDKTGRLYSLFQSDYPNPRVEIPLERSLHLTFGDSDNPEGLATMEALYRLEGIKRAYETIMGMGFEHAAGHLSVKSTEKLTVEDKSNIARLARAISSAQPGNYMAFPQHLDGQMVDVPFAAGMSLLEVIRYYSILKLALLGMQWVALSGLSGVGSYASMKDGSEMAVMLYNSMAEDFVRQMNEQIWTRLFTYPVNKAAFPNLTRRPVLKLIPLDKDIPLSELGQLSTALNAIMPLGAEDFLAIRRKTGFLPSVLPEQDAVPEPDPTPETSASDETPQDVEDSMEGDGTPDPDGEMAFEFAMVAQTLEEKIATMPEYLQNEINGLAKEFSSLRVSASRDGFARIDGIPNEVWDKAMDEDLANDEEAL